MSNKDIFLICMIAVLAPTYALFLGGAAKNIKDTNKKSDNPRLSMAISIGVVSGVVIGAILGFAIGRSGTAICTGLALGDFAGMAIGALIGKAMEKKEAIEFWRMKHSAIL